MHPLLNIAIMAARRGGDKIIRGLNRLDRIQIDAKGVNDYVTEVDRASELEIIASIREAYPDHAFLAEESGQSSNSNDNDFVWIIDPLDGTTNFIHGFPVFCVSIALRVRGRLEHGVIYDPLRQEIFSASRGEGAQLDGRRIRVSGRKYLRDSLIGTGFPYHSNQRWIDDYLQMFKVVMQETKGVRRPGAAALDLAYVAAGRIDGFWEMSLKPWDIAAGILLIRESGGRVADLEGGERYWETGHVVAGSPDIYTKLLKLIRPHIPKELFNQ